jgi:glycerophosphoryl diester phosphodiesterase
VGHDEALLPWCDACPFDWRRATGDWQNRLVTQAPYLSLEHPVRLAHRGSRILWPENTLEAFQGAVDLGYRYIETDVRITRDRVVVVFHDATLARTTNGVGEVSEWLWDDLRLLDAGWMFERAGGHPYRSRGVRISRLDEVMATFPQVHFNLDLKGAGLEWPVYEVIRRLGREDSTLVGSFVDHRAAKFRRISRDRIATAAGPSAAIGMWMAARAGRSIRHPAVAYQVPFDSKVLRFDRSYVDAIHRAGAQVHCWTVNDPADMGRLLDWGVDGIVSDRPDLLNEVVAGRWGA